MDSNKIRDSYERWATEDAASTGRTLKFERGGDWYLGRDHQAMNLGWAAWQASRKSVAVELPARRGESTRGNGFNEALTECRAAIEAQGLRVAP